MLEYDMTEATSKYLCPMSGMCKGMGGQPGSGMVVILPGFVLIGVGLLVLFQPQILAWLIAFLMIMMGVGLLFMAKMFHKRGTQTDSRKDQ
jgi:UPF0716 family protein affecting phage T7 exclusion